MGTVKLTWEGATFTWADGGSHYWAPVTRDRATAGGQPAGLLLALALEGGQSVWSLVSRPTGPWNAVTRPTSAGTVIVPTGLLLAILSTESSPDSWNSVTRS